MERPDLIDDERTCDNRARNKNRAMVLEIIEGWLAERTTAQVLAQLGGRVPVGPVNNNEMLFDDPHLPAREMLVAYQTPGQRAADGVRQHADQVHSHEGGRQPAGAAARRARRRGAGRNGRPHRIGNTEREHDGMTHRIAVIGGDGIGPEVTAEALKVVRAAGVDIDTTDFDLGGGRYLRDGEVLSDATLERAARLRRHPARRGRHARRAARA